MSAIRTRLTISNFKSPEAQQLVEEAAANGDLNILIREVAELIATANRDSGENQSLICRCLSMIGAAKNSVVYVNAPSPISGGQPNEEVAMTDVAEIATQQALLINPELEESTPVITDDTDGFDIDKMFSY